ncbi:retrotransposon protein, putative, ty1-copia subclass [Tanacetum coccineum]
MNCPAYLAELIKKKKQVALPGVLKSLLVIYEIDMHDLVPNDKSIYNKCIEKLQQEGLLKSIDDESLDGKMTRKSFLHRPERATDLLRIIYTDVCGPLRHVSRQEAEEHSLGDINEPTSYKATMLDSESNKWIDAMNAVIQSMMDNMVWVLVDLPPGCKTVRTRLVTKGYTQLYEVDYEETFPPIADIRDIWILKSIEAFYDYEIWQMDVKTAFLNGYLDEDIYMRASRSWNKRFNEEIKRFGFTQNLDKPCVYQKASGSNVTFIILYVDDIIIMGNHIPSLQSVKDYLGKCFAMKDLGEAAFILGIKIYRDRSKRFIGLSQNAYMDKILKRYKMDNSKRGHIPMQEKLDLIKHKRDHTFDLGGIAWYYIYAYIEDGVTFIAISNLTFLAKVARTLEGLVLSQRKYILDILEDCGFQGCRPSPIPFKKNLIIDKRDKEPKVDVGRYRRLVCRLLYLQVTRPDIAYSVNVLSQFVVEPRHSHMDATHQVLRYLKGTHGQGILLPRDAGCNLTVYCDLIGLAVLLQGDLGWDIFSFLEEHPFHGRQRNKMWYHVPLP